MVRTLRNAIEQDKVHHAYLFVGSRGTGKTSMAKILASCLDCEQGGPTVDPCGVCESCLSIQRATSLDVVEMDAASNNSVDDVRDLRERVQTASSGGRWRVYILDEAHMLTMQAWNALLKTLEEPPPQTVFVLATTEAHKVPATVVDRCHRFDFTRPTGAQIKRVLGRVAERESLQLSEGAQALVARHANGSFRDALGTLEQLVTYAGQTVTEDDAVAVLGIGDEAQMFAVVDRVIEGDPAGVLRGVQEVASHGRDLGSFMHELERHGRDLLVSCILGEVPPEVRLTADRDALLAGQAQRIGRDQAARLLELLAAGLTAARDGADARAMLELALVKAAAPDIDPALHAVQARLARVEQHLGGGAPVAAAPASAQPITPGPASAGPAAPAPPVAAQPAPASQPVAQPAPAPQSSQAQAPAPPTPPASVRQSAPMQPAPAPAPQSAPMQPAPMPGTPAIETVQAVWGAVIENLRGRDQLCAVALEQARPVDVNGEELTIAFPTDAAFYRGTADRDERRAALREALRDVTGVALAPRFELRDAAPASAPQPSAGDPQPGAAQQPGVPVGGGAPQGITPPPVPASIVLDEHAAVAHLMSDFDAEEIRDPEEPS